MNPLAWPLRLVPARLCAAAPHTPGVGRPPCRVLLIDDSLAFLTVAGDFLAREPGLQVVGRFVSAGDALRELDDLAPDVVVSDLMMPGLNGLEFLRRVRRLPRLPRVIVVSLHQSDELRARLAEAGADAFVPKDQVAAELAPAIRRLAGPDTAATP